MGSQVPGLKCRLSRQQCQGQARAVSAKGDKGLRCESVAASCESLERRIIHPNEKSQKRPGRVLRWAMKQACYCLENVGTTMQETMKPPRAPLNAVRLLRCHRTRNYFDGQGWADNSAHAQCYPNEIEAARACVSHGLHDVELVLQAPGTGTVLFASRLR